MPFDGASFAEHETLRKIDAVIDLLDAPDKWCKGALRSHDGRYCIRGAVRAVDATDLLEPTILHAIGEVAGKRFRRIESFNDHPNTSHEQVITVLSRARDNIVAGRLQTPPKPATVARQPSSPWRRSLFGWLTG